MKKHFPRLPARFLSLGIAPFAFLVALGSLAQAQTVPAGSQAFGWGYNTYGRLGTGNQTTALVPVATTTSGVLSGKTVSQVTTGGFGSMVLCTDGTLASWGYNGDGELGNGTTTDSLVPVAVTRSGVLSGKTVVQIEMGRLHCVALCSDGTLVSWGNNDAGAVGDGTLDDVLVPKLVDTSGVLSGKTVTKIAAGAFHSLALCSDGTLVSWGNNPNGELGDGTTDTATVPVLVNQSGALSGKTITQISGGVNHSVVLCSDGTVVTWGINTRGQLGTGNLTSSTVPVAINQGRVLSGKTVTQIAAGGYHCLALCSDGTVAAWGGNETGTLGNGTTTNASSPILVNRSGVLSGKTVTQITGGASHSMALCSDGTVASWGYNAHGELGNGTKTSSRIPVLVNKASGSALNGKTVWKIAQGSGSFHSFSLAYPTVSVPVNSAPTSVSLTPENLSSNSSEARQLSITYSDADGQTDIDQMRIIIGSSTNAGADVLYGYYDARYKLYLYNDSGSSISKGYTPGSNATISNSQGKLNCKETTVVRSGNNLTVNWNFTPNGFYTGAKKVLQLRQRQRRLRAKVSNRWAHGQSR